MHSECSAARITHAKCGVCKKIRTEGLLVKKLRKLVAILDFCGAFDSLNDIC